jgi:hypothetical protein
MHNTSEERACLPAPFGAGRHKQSEEEGLPLLRGKYGLYGWPQTPDVFGMADVVSRKKTKKRGKYVETIYLVVGCTAGSQNLAKTLYPHLQQLRDCLQPGNLSDRQSVKLSDIALEVPAAGPEAVCQCALCDILSGRPSGGPLPPAVISAEGSGGFPVSGRIRYHCGSAADAFQTGAVFLDCLFLNCMFLHRLFLKCMFIIVCSSTAFEVCMFPSPLPRPAGVGGSKYLRQCVSKKQLPRGQPETERDSIASSFTVL